MAARNALDSSGYARDLNFTFALATSEHRQFPDSLISGEDRNLRRSYAALVSFEPEPDQPEVHDIDPTLRFASR